MELYRNRNAIHGKKQTPGTVRRTGENDPLDSRTATDRKYSQSEIAKDNDEDMSKVFQALKTIQESKFEQLEQLLAEEKKRKQQEHEMLKSMFSSREQELLKEKHEKSQLLKLVEEMDKESKSYQTQLQEKERQLQEHERGRHWQVEYENLEKRYKDLQRNFDQHQMMVAEKIKIENEHEIQKSVLRSKEQELLKEKSEKSQLLKLVKNMDQESESLKAHLQEKEKQLKEQREATKKAYTEKNDALTRLSHMGHQMSEENPNNTDLSDPNRPSKLGERYSELYDNEWINAFDVLTETFDMDEKEAIDVLRNILLESYKSALDISRSQMEEAEYKLAGSSKAVSPECKRLLKEARKHIDIKQSDSLHKNALEKTITKAIDKKYLNETIIQVFAKQCFQLCWLMTIQDPPVVLAEGSIKGDHFDTNMYKYNINSGDTIDYVVWPALLLHKGGPLLTKGIAQPVPKPRPKSAFTLRENKKTDNGASDKFSRSLYVGKVQDIPSPADRRTPSQVGYTTQWDTSSRKKPDNDPIETRTNLSQGDMAQTQRRTTNAMQFDINPSLVNDQDTENFKRFCYLYPKKDELTMKELFGSDFERFYHQYIVQRFGNQSSA